MKEENTMAKVTGPKGQVSVSMNTLEVHYTCGCGRGNLIFHKDRTRAMCRGCGDWFGMRVIVGRVAPKQGDNDAGI
jgi:hypothetical protein